MERVNELNKMIDEKIENITNIEDLLLSKNPELIIDFLNNMFEVQLKILKHCINYGIDNTKNVRYTTHIINKMFKINSKNVSFNGKLMLMKNIINDMN